MFPVKREGEEVRILIHNNDNCVSCGICVKICPTESLRLGPIVPIARGLIDMEKVSVNNNGCVLCGLCAVSCPFNCLDLNIDSESVHELENYPKWKIQSEVNQDQCIYCGRCYNVCPQDSILFERILPSREDLVKGLIEINNEKCIYCNICAELCPSEAITLTSKYNDDKVDNVITVDESKCVYCGVCRRACPKKAIKTVCTTCMSSDEIAVPEITGETSIIEKDCVYCSWCAEICPTDAITVIKPFSGLIELIETEEAKCKGTSCHACVDVCPCNAVEIIDNISVTNPDFCNLCGACIGACPQHIRHIDRNSMNLININSQSWDEILKLLLN